MAGIESPLPPFYAPPEFNFENIKNGEIFSWVFWNTLYVIVTPVKATLYLGSLAWNKLSGKPISSRDVQPEKACPKVNPNYVSTKTPAENTPQAASCDHFHSPVIPLQKVSTRPDGLSQKSSQAVTSQGPVKIPKQSQYQYAQQQNEAQKSQSALVNQQRVDEINERNFKRGVKQSMKLAERLKFREDRRAARENSLAEQRRSRGRSQAEQALLTQDSAISIVEDAQSTQQFQMDDEAYCDYQLAQFEREDVRIAYEQSLPVNDVQQQDRFDTQQTQQAILESIQHQDISDPQIQQVILSSIQQSCRSAPVDVPELVVQLPEEGGLRGASVHSLHGSQSQQPDTSDPQMQQGILASLQQQPPMTQLDVPALVVQLPEEDDARVYTHRRLDSSNIQQDISNQQTPQAILDSFIQQLASVTPSAIPIPVVQLPLRTVLEHVVHENKSRKADQQIYIDNVREKLRDKQADFAKIGIDVAQIPEEVIKQFISGWEISRDEFYSLYRSTPDPEIVLKLARELVEHIDKERLAQEQEKRAREQEARLAKEVAEAAKLAAKNRLVDAPPEGHDGIFSIRFQTTGGQKITRRFWPHDTVQSIFDFAHINGYPPSAFIFVVNDAPGHRRILDELLLRLSELQMTNRFVVRIEERE